MAVQSKVFSFARGNDAQDYSFVLNGNTNVLQNANTVGEFQLSDPNNNVEVTYAGYSHADNNNWGTIANNGYFRISDDNRIGGLTNISYHINGELTLEFGYEEFGKPTYYSASLPAELNSFNFPENKGYPNTFKISNASGSDIVIQDMAFFYTCSQNDEHEHVSLFFSFFFYFH